MTVRWTPRALADIESVHDYIAQDKPGAASGVVEHILDGLDALTRHPEMGRPGRVRGTRELIVAPFVVAYRVAGGAIEVVAIVHGRRRWPSSL